MPEIINSMPFCPFEMKKRAHFRKIVKNIPRRTPYQESLKNDLGGLIVEGRKDFNAKNPTHNASRIPIVRLS